MGCLTHPERKFILPDDDWDTDLEESGSGSEDDENYVKVRIRYAKFNNSYFHTPCYEAVFGETPLVEVFSSYIVHLTDLYDFLDKSSVLCFHCGDFCHQIFMEFT